MYKDLKGNHPVLIQKIVRYIEDEIYGQTYIQYVFDEMYRYGFKMDEIESALAFLCEECIIDVPGGFDNFSTGLMNREVMLHYVPSEYPIWLKEIMNTDATTILNGQVVSKKTVEDLKESMRNLQDVLDSFRNGL